MSTALIAGAVAVAIAAAVRSTWSPCGLSMLSTVTPVAERARGHRYGATCAWFIAGATVGGLTLGSGAAVLAVLVGATDPTARVVLICAAVAALGSLALVPIAVVAPTALFMWLTGLRPRALAPR